MKYFLIVIFSLIFLYFLINQLAVNSYDGATFSDDKLKSKASGAFIHDFIPGKDSIQLLKRKIQSPSAWIEYGINDYHFLIFFRKEKHVKNEFNLIFNLPNLCKSGEFIFDFSASHQTLNCWDSIGQVHRTYTKLDSFTLYIKQGSPYLGWNKEVIVDSVVYIAQNRPKRTKFFR